MEVLNVLSAYMITMVIRDTSAELLLPGIHVRHAALERDKRCLLAYV